MGFGSKQESHINRSVTLKLKDDYIEDDDVGEIGRSGHDHALLSGSDDHVLEVWLTAKVGQKKS